MSVLLGKNFAGTAANIEDVMNTKQPIITIVEGEIFDLVTRKTRNDSFLHEGGIFDGTTSMFFQFFHDEELSLKEGMSLKIQGKAEPNRFKGGEITIMAQNILETESKVKERICEAKEKMVHLQNYTYLTEKRGAMNVSDMIKEAKKLGMKAVAITDVGGVQGFPEAYSTGEKEGIDIIYGLTGKFIDMDSIVFQPTNEKIKDATFVLVDVETTGFSTRHDHLIELGAARFRWDEWSGNLVKVDEFNRLIYSPKRIPPHITEITGITNEMLEKDGVDLENAMQDFLSYMQDGVLVAHNAQFDRGHINAAFKRANISVPDYTLIDTLMLSRTVNTEYKKHGLGALVKKEKVKLDNHHRATDDAIATGYIFSPMLEKVFERGVETFDKINELQVDEHYQFQFPFEATILVKNQTGLKNLYKIVSESHIHYLSSAGNIGSQGRYPVIPRHLFEKYREGLLLGSGSHLGKVFDYALNKDVEELREIMKSHDYDFYEIQPHTVAEHLWKNDNPKTDGEGNILAAWQTVYEEAKKLGKLIVASGHVHHTTKEKAVYHNILLYSALPPSQMKHEKRPGREEYPQGMCHFRSTTEMLKEFPWLSDEQAHEIVVTNTNKVYEMIEKVEPIPNKLYTPEVPGKDSAKELEKLAYDTAKEWYGDPIPEHIKERLDRELESIIGNGYAVIYYVSHLLVKKSLEDGYLVGSRGSIGSSFAATMTGITEVNPLRPHYRCKACKWSAFFNHGEMSSGFDLPYSFKELLSEHYSEDAKAHFVSELANALSISSKDEILKLMESHEESTCPKCGEKSLLGDGQDIPFETFLGFKGDKVPDIDLNFSGVYQPKAHQFIWDMFHPNGIEGDGKEYVFRAGTIGTVADKTAFASVRSYIQNHGKKASSAEYSRMSKHVLGAKQNTGQHPGGKLVCPLDKDIEDFTPIQYPANDPTATFKTSHFDFHAIHDYILKFDILGHDMPTNLRIMKDLTGFDPRNIPNADPKVLKLWYDTEEALGVHHDEFKARTGTLGLPEMGTRVVQDVIVESKPKTYSDLVTLSGLTHGTDVYYNNAQELIKNGTCTIKDVIGCRDDIMRYLLLKGMEPGLSFKIMEAVRKGKGLTPEWEEEMKKNNVPDWYIWSCKLIKYMFPKAHASAYVTDAMRMGYYKVYYPIEFYAGIFTARYNDQDFKEITLPADAVRTRMDQIDGEVSALLKQGEGNKANKLKRLKGALNIALEAKVRGIKFGKIRLYMSHANEYRIDYKTNELIPPFSSIDGIGDTVAAKIFEEAQKGPFLGIDDLKARTGANKNNIDILRSIGCLEHVEAKQHRFF